MIVVIVILVAMVPVASCSIYRYKISQSKNVALFATKHFQDYIVREYLITICVLFTHKCSRSKPALTDSSLCL